jgi:hypothetical protein
MNRGSRESEERARIGVGLVAAGLRSSQVLEVCGEDLREFLEGHFPDFQWDLQKEDTEGGRGDSLEFLDIAQGRMVQAKWQFCFVVVDEEPEDVPRDDLGVLSFSYSAAIIYLPRLYSQDGNDSEGVIANRCRNLILAYFARLNGLPRMEGARMTPGELDGDLLFDADELKHIDNSLHGLADSILRRGVKELRGLALYARILFTHPVRVMRAVFNHRPLLIVFGLGKLVFAAVAALVLALLSAELWHLGVEINTWRIVLIAAAVLLTATFYVVFRQKLYVSRVSLSLSEQAAFFNLTSFLTVFCVLFILFLIILAVTSLASLGIYPRYIVRQWLQKGQVDILDYVKVSLLVSSLVMVVGALGAGLEENRHFRRVMYTERNR